MKTVTLLIALTQAEEEDFLPPDVRTRLEALPLRLVEIRLPLPSPDDWRRVLGETNPDALLCAWACPALPEDLTVGAEGGLRYVAYLAGSMRKLMPRSLLERGLRATNWGSSISRTIAECSLLLILSAMRRASFWSVAMHRDGGWKQGLQTVTQSLFEKRVGIHGFGQIARHLVPLLRPFGVEISAHAPDVADAVMDNLGVKRSPSLEELFSGNDVIVELAPYHAGNHHIINEAILRSIPPGGVFVNIARGAMVDEEALIRVARERAEDLQVGLDVYEQEPLPKESALRGLPNVALLPHIAGPTKDRRRDTTRLAIENLGCFVRGEAIPNCMTPEIYDLST